MNGENNVSITAWNLIESLLVILKASGSCCLLCAATKVVQDPLKFKYHMLHGLYEEQSSKRLVFLWILLRFLFVDWTEFRCHFLIFTNVFSFFYSSDMFSSFCSDFRCTWWIQWDYICLWADLFGKNTHHGGAVFLNNSKEHLSLVAHTGT